MGWLINYGGENIRDGLWVKLDNIMGLFIGLLLQMESVEERGGLLTGNFEGFDEYF